MSQEENNYDLNVPVPLQLKRTCTGCNCVCWMDGVNDKCIPYNTCLKCYKSLEYCELNNCLTKSS